MSASKLKLFFFLMVGIMTTIQLNSCGNPEDENVIDDPTTIYSLIREDTSSGIDMVGSSRSNPMEVRKRIFESEIPENTFEQKRKALYAILDTLHKFKEYRDRDIYNEVDSLNYLAIHYLKDLLTDRKSRAYPISHKMLKQVFSPNRKLYVYSWEENIGVDIPTTISVFQYTGLDGQLHSFFNQRSDDKDDFHFSTSRITAIYKLPSNVEKSLYLLNFEGCTGNDNFFKGSTIIEIIENELSFDYDSFGDGIKYIFENYVQGEKLTLSYNPKNKELTYLLHTAENTVERKTFLFNGEVFELK